MVELLRNDNENDMNPNIIVGTLNKLDLSEVPRGVKKIIDVIYRPYILDHQHAYSSQSFFRIRYSDL